MARKPPDKQAPIRRADGRFAPGRSGNPAGRPKGLTISEHLREEAEKLDRGVPKGRLVAIKAIEMAMAGDMRAIEFVTARLDGKVPDKLVVAEESDDDAKATLERKLADLAVEQAPR